MAARRKVFTLLVEMRCNSYCVFCGLRQIDEPLVRARARVGLSTPPTVFGGLRGRYTLESAVAELRQARADGYGELSLQGGEPTIWPDIVALVREARALGFEFIGIVTNGRKLADAQFAADLVEAGLDGITGSLVGWNADTHDATALVSGAFDELVLGLANASAAAARSRRTVTINANVITSAKTVDHLPEQVRLLAQAGVRAAVVHLVRFSAMGSDPVVRSELRFDVRRMTPALERARAEAARLGISLHASDVPMCLHPRLEIDELRVLLHRSAVKEHQYRGASFGFDGMPSRKQPAIDACDGCLLADVCPRVPPEHLPEPANEALRAITAARVKESADELLATLDPTREDAARLVADRAASVEVLAQLQPGRPELAAAVERLREALQDLTRLSYANGRAALMIEAFWSYLGLKPPGWDLSEVAMAAPRWPAALLAQRTGAVSSDQTMAGPRLRFGPRYEVALTGGAVERGEMSVETARPIVYPVQSADERLGRALFLACVCVPVRSARAVRVLEDRVLVDAGSGYTTAWTFQRAGAIALVAG
jgi:molybdenum cofactor biosynthesis enzyme MoaA